jgi:ADP-ribosyl-[dinitrogen reductase] hydrolase
MTRTLAQRHDREAEMPTGVEVTTARARGALFGLACGDALGTTTEFMTPEAPPFPKLAVGPQTQVLGGGPFGLIPGQTTDDTQQAVLLASSLCEFGRYDPQDVACRLVAWRSDAFDIGAQTSSALAEIARGTDPREAGRLVWSRARNPRPAGNGSLMRTAPIGVFPFPTPEQRREASFADSSITHFDPKCQLACAVLNATIWSAINTRAGPSYLLDVARAEAVAAAEVLASRDSSIRQEVETAQRALLEDLTKAQDDDPKLYGPELHLHWQQGYVRVALRLTFWELLHAPDFESALVDVVNRGGDADTNGAICGSLLGAVFGESGIPQKWRNAVLNARPPDPWDGLYHPKRLIEFVEAVTKLYDVPEEEG